MTITTVLVHIEREERSRACLEAAIAIARDHRARLTGLHVIPSTVTPVVTEVYARPALLAEQIRLAREEAASREADFRARAESAGLTSEWRCEEGDAYEIVTLHARYSDVTVVGQTPPEGPEGRLLLQLPEQVVLSSGRPAMVVPYAGTFAEPPRRVLIAWNGSREAARAVHDALPFLERAEQVTILGVNPGEQRHIVGADIAAHLTRHGVRVEAGEIGGNKLGVGDVLLSRAVDLGADLLVMGAYGHSRAREWVTGGATRHLLKYMTLPVLMSH